MSDFKHRNETPDWIIEVAAEVVQNLWRMLFSEVGMSRSFKFAQGKGGVY